MQLNPILNKEMKLGARSIKLSIVIMLYNAVLALVAILSLAAFSADYSRGFNINFSSLNNIFIALGWIQCIVVCLMVPVLTASSIAGERERQTLDMMLTTAVKPISIVSGKLLSSLLTVFILIFSSLPILSIAFILGGMSWVNIIYFILIVLGIAIAAGSLGIFCSALMKKTTAAIIMTFVFGTVLILGSVIMLIAVFAILNVNAYDPVTGASKMTGLGGGVLILLVNPIVTFFEFMQRTTGAVGINNVFVTMFGVDQNSWVYDFSIHYWIPASIFVQLVISAFCLKGAANLINPIRHRRIKKIKESKVNQTNKVNKTE